MSQRTNTTYACDRCGKKLKTFQNTLNIETSLSEDNHAWSRLHVLIIHRHGYHNSADEDQADLCKLCAIALLQDALRRVKKGERATAGTEEIEQQGWN